MLGKNLQIAAAGAVGEEEPAIGAAFEGGFYAGKIRFQGIVYYLIIAPAATGASGTGYTITTNRQWKTTNDTTAGTLSAINGARNTASMSAGNHPAADFCKGLSIGGFSDWYLPARYELDAAYFNLKPTTNSNSTSWGINPYSIPERTVNYTAGNPAQTTVTSFQTGNTEAFVAGDHWSSTEGSATIAWSLSFSNGFQSNFNKNSLGRVRAFRRVVSPFQTDPTLNPLGLLPGDPLQGGYFAGYISQTNNGVPTHALIVAPKASGESASLQWKTSNTSTPGTSSPFDGAANTAAMDNASHPAAQYCAGLTIGGYSDWYLPARYELDIAYFHLKPTTTSNDTSWGINDYSVPKRTANYTAGDPARTPIAAFQDGGAEAFVAGFHWSSTGSSATTAWGLTFSDGDQNTFLKDFSTRVRAFRKFAL